MTVERICISCLRLHQDEASLGLTGLSFTGSNLGKSRLNLGVERVLGHDEDDAIKSERINTVNLVGRSTDDVRKVLVDQSERSVLELSSKDLCVEHIIRI
jgi:hypothetical protein